MSPRLGKRYENGLTPPTELQIKLSKVTMTKTEIIKKVRALKVIKRFISYNIFYITPHYILSDMAQDMMDGKVTAEEFKGAIYGITKMMDKIIEDSKDEYYQKAWKELAMKSEKRSYDPCTNWYNTISFPAVNGNTDGDKGDWDD